MRLSTRPDNLAQNLRAARHCTSLIPNTISCFLVVIISGEELQKLRQTYHSKELYRKPKNQTLVLSASAREKEISDLVSH